MPPPLSIRPFPHQRPPSPPAATPPKSPTQNQGSADGVPTQAAPATMTVSKHKKSIVRFPTGYLAAGKLYQEESTTDLVESGTNIAMTPPGSSSPTPPKSKIKPEVAPIIPNGFFRDCQIKQPSSEQEKYLSIVPSKYALSAWDKTVEINSSDKVWRLNLGNNIVSRVVGKIKPNGIYVNHTIASKNMSSKELEENESALMLHTLLVKLCKDAGDTKTPRAIQHAFGKLHGTLLFEPGDPTVKKLKEKFEDSYPALFEKPKPKRAGSNPEASASGQATSTGLNGDSTTTPITSWLDEPKRFESVVLGMSKGNYPYAMALLEHKTFGPLVRVALSHILPAPSSNDNDSHPTAVVQTALLRNSLLDLQQRKIYLDIVEDKSPGQGKYEETPLSNKQKEQRIENAKADLDSYKSNCNIVDFTDEEFGAAQARLNARLFTLVNAERYGGPAAVQLMGLTNGKIIDSRLTMPHPWATKPETIADGVLMAVRDTTRT
jgi:hypothetical protein